MAVTIVSAVAVTVGLVLGGLGLAALGRALPVAKALYVLGWALAAFLPVGYVGRLLLEAGLADLAVVVTGVTWAVLLVVGVVSLGAPLFREVQPRPDRHTPPEGVG